MRAVRAVADGWSYVDPISGSVRVGPGASDPVTVLNEREREILHLLADGMGNEEIGSALFIPAQAVETHIKHAIEKL